MVPAFFAARCYVTIIASLKTTFWGGNMLRRRIFKCMLCVMSVMLASAAGSASRAQSPADEPLTLQMRTRIEVAPDADRWHSILKPMTWTPSATCIVVCDMWDDHWCKQSAARVSEMAPKMNEVIKQARARGVFIIHCPSDTMDFYKDFPQRKLAQAAPVVETQIPLERWCYLDKTREGEKLPIDDSDGGCDCDSPVKNYRGAVSIPRLKSPNRTPSPTVVKRFI